nr:hypothetical protein [uncultured Steroidobacter sp.]
MKRPIFLAAAAAAVLVQGCATSSIPSTATQSGTAGSESASPMSTLADSNSVSHVTICTKPNGCQPGDAAVAHGDDIGPEKNAPLVDGHPLPSVVVTQCNLLVAVYMTMPDGRLLRFDNKAEVAAEELVSMAYTATRSERVEVSCEGTGASGYETHGPV